MDPPLLSSPAANSTEAFAKEKKWGKRSRYFLITIVYLVTFLVSQKKEIAQINVLSVEDDILQLGAIGPFDNSQSWLNGPRFSNIEMNMTDDLVLKLITDNSFGPTGLKSNRLHVLSQQTLCPNNSKFLHWDWKGAHHERTVDASFVTSLMYGVIHDNQHKPARTEALARRKYPSHFGALRRVGNYDYECEPDTKFIVFSIPSGRGFGMNFRAFGVEPLMLGVLMDRVALYIQPADEHFFYSDCPRRDMQCFFMPLSPCVLTQQDMKNAVRLTSEDIQHFRNTGNFSEPLHSNMKVLVVTADNLNRHAYRLHETFGEKIAQIYLPDKKTQNSHSANNTMLSKVQEFIADPKNQWLPWNAAMMYSLRPNAFLNTQLQLIWNKSVPSHFNPDFAIGIPIRDGDKCARESQCMSFDNYMQLALEMSVKRSKELYAGNNTNLTPEGGNPYKFIVLTSDTKGMTEQRFNYERDPSFKFDFVVNADDIGQGHGKPKQYSDKDTVMVDTFAALKLQLTPETLIINSCSNFHKLIASFYLGCGGGGKNGGHLETLLENDNPKFRMKCAWR
eukprot:CCRYP_007761-RA/>CCRYP_007761-RA protein AED:0.11 eAED:0.11 QI:0/-1/0/1/-1/1/1/0/561